MPTKFNKYAVGSGCLEIPGIKDRFWRISPEELHSSTSTGSTGSPAVAKHLT
jgi:hypothetical protein